MRGLIFTLDAVLALSVIAAALLIVNAFSNTIHQDTLAMHVTARDVASLSAKGITLPEGTTPSTVLEKEEVTGGAFISTAFKRYYEPCSCNEQTCDLRANDAACLNALGEVKSIQAWSAK